MAGEGQSEGQDYTRLHITPLTPALLPTFLPPSVLPIARNISYHTIETFPERAYGFVELPSMEATKLQKKLNGSILKGTKIRIETAKPQKLPVPDENPEPERPKKEQSKKRKRDETIPAIEIGERSVKRGWTTPSSKTDKKSAKKDKKSKSKYSDGKECLFKTVVPPNKVEKKDGKKKRKNNREEVVHEFERTTKHASFLRGSKIDGKSKTASEFVEGKGWVDEDGNLIEEVTIKQKPATKKERKASKDQSSDDTTSESDDSAPEADAMDVNGDSEESEAESSETDSSEEESSAEKATRDVQDAVASSSDSSSEEESGSSADSSDSEGQPVDKSSEQDVETPSQSVGNGRPGSRPDSSSGLTITIPPPTTLTTTAADSKSVHPLEALYKRPASTPASKGHLGVPRPEVPAFSFFGNDQDLAESHEQVPFTPFTQREFEFRGQRSAAPTPDTAHPNRRFMWPVDDESDHEDGEDEEGETPSGKDKGKGVAVAGKDESGEGKEAESDFQKWFYENRGETNRAWKKRRKAAAKETRQRENRKRADRAA